MEYYPLINKLNDEPNWYVIITRSRADKKVADLLVNEGYETYLPLTTQWRQWSDRKKKVTIPLIPSVVFVRTYEKKLSHIVRLENIVRTLYFLGKPAVVRVDEIDTLRQLSSGGAMIQKINPVDLCFGEEVEIMRGPLAGIKAKFLNHQGKYKIIVLIETTGSYFQLEVALNNIQKLNISA